MTGPCSTLALTVHVSETASEVLDTLCGQRALGFGERCALVGAHEEFEERALLHLGNAEAEPLEALALRQGALAVGVGTHLQVTARRGGSRRLGAAGAWGAARAARAARAAGGAGRGARGGSGIAGLGFVA